MLFCRFLTSDGMEREETGRIEESRGNTILRIIGYYSYIDSNGKPYKLFYQADEGGSKIEDNLMASTLSPSTSTTPPSLSPISDLLPLQWED